MLTRKIWDHTIDVKKEEDIFIVKRRKRRDI